MVFRNAIQCFLNYNNNNSYIPRVKSYMHAAVEPCLAFPYKWLFGILPLTKFRPGFGCVLTSLDTSGCTGAFAGNHCAHVLPSDCTRWGSFETGRRHHGAQTRCNPGGSRSDRLNSSSLEHNTHTPPPPRTLGGETPTVTWLDHIVMCVCKTRAHPVCVSLPSALFKCRSTVYYINTDVWLLVW